MLQHVVAVSDSAICKNLKKAIKQNDFGDQDSAPATREAFSPKTLLHYSLEFKSCMCITYCSNVSE